MKGKSRYQWPVIFLALLLAVSLTVTGCGKKSSKDKSSSSSESSSDSMDEEDSSTEEAPDDDETDSSGSEDNPSDADDESGDEAPGGGDVSAVGPQGGTPPAGSSSQSAKPSAPAPAPPPASPSSSQPPAQTRPPEDNTSKPSTSSPSSSSKSSSSKSSSSSSTGRLADITYQDAGSYSKEASYQDGVIRGDNIILRNKIFYGDLDITSSVGKDDISLENVEVKGTLTVNGGTGWVKLYDSKIAKLVADKKGAKIYASKKTDVGSVVIRKNATLQEGTLPTSASGFENVTVSGDKKVRTDLDLQKMSLDKLTIDSQSWVTLDKDTKVERVNADAPTYIKGTGSVRSLVASNDNVYYQTKPVNISTSGKADRPQKYDPDDNYWDRGDNSSSSRDDDDYDSENDDVYITWLDSISGIRLREGDGKQSVSFETNARTVTATSSNTAVVGVSVDDNNELILRPYKTGTAKITVKGTRSGYNSEIKTFTVDVEKWDSSAPRITNLTYWTGNTQIGEGQWTTQNVTLKFDVETANLDYVTVAGGRVTGYRGQYSHVAKLTGDYPIVAVGKKSNSTSTKNAKVNIDSQDPKIAGISWPSSANGYLLRFSATDTGGSGVAAVSVNSGGKVTNLPLASNGNYSLTDSVAGSHRVTITVTDKAGRRHEVYGDVTGPSNAAPTIDVTYSTPQTTWTQSRVTVTIKSKNGAGSYIDLDNYSALGLGRSAIGQYTYTTDKNISFVLQATDRGQTVSKEVKVGNIDNTNPVVTVLQWPWQNPADNTLKFTAADMAVPPNGPSGVKAVTVAVNNNAPVAISPTDGVYTYPDAAVGVHTLTVRVADNAGNFVEAKNTVTPPTVTQLVLTAVVTPNGWTNGDKTVTFSSADGKRLTGVTVNGQPVPLIDGAFKYVATQNVTLQNIMATDETGRSTGAPIEVLVDGIDKTKPEIQVTNWPAAGNPLLIFRVSESESGVNNVTVSVDGGQATSISASPDGSYVYTDGKIGAHTLTIQAVDHANNLQTLVSGTLSLPDASPLPLQTSVTPDGWTNGNKIIIFSTTDGKKLTDVSVGGQPASPVGDGTFRYEAADDADLNVMAKDESGRIANTTLRVDKIDKTPPVISDIHWPEVGDTMLTFNVSDDKSGINGVQVSVDGGSATTLPHNGRGISISYPDEIKTPHSLTITVQDLAGNLKTETQDQISTVDTTPLTVSADVPDGSAKDSKLVTIDVENANAALASATVGGQPMRPTGKTFTYEASQNGSVDVTVTDQDGRTGTTSFIVNGIDKEKPVIQINEKPADGWHAAAQTIKFSVSDDGSISSVTATDQGSPIAVSRSGGNYSIAVSTSGSHAVTIHAEDGVGHITDSAALPVKVDLTVPVAPSVVYGTPEQQLSLQPAANLTDKTDFYLLGAIAGETAAQSAVWPEYRLTDTATGVLLADWAKGTAVASKTDRTKIQTLIQGKKYTLEVRSVNGAGTVSPVVTYSLDVKAPPKTSKPDQGKSSKEESSSKEDKPSKEESSSKDDQSSSKQASSDEAGEQGNVGSQVEPEP